MVTAGIRTVLKMTSAGVTPGELTGILSCLTVNACISAYVFLFMTDTSGFCHQQDVLSTGSKIVLIKMEKKGQGPMFGHTALPKLMPLKPFPVSLSSETLNPAILPFVLSLSHLVIMLCIFKYKSML